MPQEFTKLLAARLSRNSALPVRECESGEKIAPGRAFLAPGDTHMFFSSDDHFAATSSDGVALADWLTKWVVTNDAPLHVPANF